MRRTVATLITSVAVACVIGASVVAQTTMTPKPLPNKSFFFFNQEEVMTVKGLPYTAEATTKVNLVMFDGTRMNQSVTAKIYRDSAGRTRREQAVIGIEALDPNPSVSSVVQIVDPVARAIYTLNPGSKTAIRRSMDELTPKIRVQKDCLGNTPVPGWVCFDGNWLPKDLRDQALQDLGTKTIEGLTAKGTRALYTIRAGQAGNDRPIEIIDETWMSTDLQVALQTLHRDPRSGDIEYTLTKISRQEPDPSLFKVPAGYEIRGESQK